MSHRVRPRQLIRLGEQLQISRKASSTPNHPRYGEREIRRAVGSLPKTEKSKDSPLSASSNESAEDPEALKGPGISEKWVHRHDRIGRIKAARPRVKTKGREGLSRLENAMRRNQEGDTESVTPRLSSAERRALESASLLEQYGLAAVLEKKDAPGVRIDQHGQLSITSEKNSRLKRKTALVLSRASTSLTEYDFVKLLGLGKQHIDGWRGQGGLEQIIPLRHHRTLLRTTSWALIFATPAHATEYQERARRLHRQAGYHTPTSPTSKIAPPPNFVGVGVDGMKVQDYTLTSPWQNLSLVAEISPFSDDLQRAIDIHDKLIAPPDHGDHQGRRPERSFPIRFWVDQHNEMELTADIINKILTWDGASRGSRWRVVEGQNAITPLVDLHAQDILKGADNLENIESRVMRAENWRINFRHASEARRFMRVWHRTPLPRFSGLPYSDPQPLVKVECLF